MRTLFYRGLIRSVGLLFIFCLFTSCNASSKQEVEQKQDGDTSLPSATLPPLNGTFSPDIQKKFEEKLKSGNFHGTAVIFNSKGEYFSFSNGFADSGKRLRNDTSTLFQIASVTKHITARAIIDLVKENKLSLSDPVSKHLKQKFPYGNIRIKDLLDQTSGLPDFTELKIPTALAGKGPDNNEIISAYVTGNPKLKFTPGTRYDYVNINYIILASIVENISGLKYEQYVREKLFGAAGTANVYQNSEMSNIGAPSAVSYQSVISKYIPVSKGATAIFENRKGSGGLWTSAEALTKWYRYLFFRNDEYYNYLTKYKPNTSSFLLGWYPSGSGKTGYFYNHGAFPGFTAWTGYIPETRTVVLLLENHSGNAKTTGEQLIKVLLNDK